MKLRDGESICRIKKLEQGVHCDINRRCHRREKGQLALLTHSIRQQDPRRGGRGFQQGEELGRMRDETRHRRSTQNKQVATSKKVQKGRHESRQAKGGLLGSSLIQSAVMKGQERRMTSR